MTLKMRRLCKLNIGQAVIPIGNLDERERLDELQAQPFVSGSSPELLLQHKSSHKLRDCSAGLKDRGWSRTAAELGQIVGCFALCSPFHGSLIRPTLAVYQNANLSESDGNLIFYLCKHFIKESKYFLFFNKS